MIWNEAWGDHQKQVQISKERATLESNSKTKISDNDTFDKLLSNIKEEFNDELDDLNERKSNEPPQKRLKACQENEKKFECTLCHQKFENQLSCSDHLKTIHNENHWRRIKKFTNIPENNIITIDDSNDLIEEPLEKKSQM